MDKFEIGTISIAVMVIVVVTGYISYNMIFDNLNVPVFQSPNCNNGTLADYCHTDTFYWCKGYGNSTSPVNMSDCKIVELH